MNENREGTATLPAPRRGLRPILNQSGQAMAEVGISIVLFFVLVFGILDAGRMLWSYSLVSNAAREAVRYAIVRGSKSGAREASSGEIADIARQVALGLNPLEVNVSWDPNNDPGGVVRVEVAYNFAPAANLFPVTTIRLASASEMVISK